VGQTELRTLARSSAVAFAARLGSAIAALACNVYIARLLGADLTGLYFLGTTSVTVASTVGRVGLDNSVVRFAAPAAATGDLARLRGVFRGSLAVAVLASTVIAVALYFAAPLLAERVFSKPGLEDVLEMMALAIVPASVVMLSSNLFRAVKRALASVIAQSGLVPALTLLLLLAIGAPGALGAASTAYTSASIAAALACLLAWWRFTPGLGRHAPDFPVRTLLASSLPLYSASLMTLGMTWFPLFALGAWSSAGDVGIFGAATRTAAFQGFIVLAINTVAGPRFAELAGARDVERLRTASRDATRLALWSATPPALILIAAAKPIMGVFGPEFTAGAGILVVLVLGQYINVITGPAGQLLTMTGHEHQVRNLRLVALIVNVVLSFVLIPRYAGMGAAFVTSTTVAVYNLGAAWLARRVLRGGRLDS
jgi:O-antigen/teichoic acid export membrane protein